MLRAKTANNEGPTVPGAAEIAQVERRPASLTSPTLPVTSDQVPG